MTFKTVDELKEFLLPTTYECGECTFKNTSSTEMKQHTQNHEDMKKMSRALEKMHEDTAEPIPELQDMLDDA